MKCAEMGKRVVILECGDKDEKIDCESFKSSGAKLKSLDFTTSGFLSSARKSLNNL